MVEASPRPFDVHQFYGDPSRASTLLGWRARVDIAFGFTRLIDDIEGGLPATVPDAG